MKKTVLFLVLSLTINSFYAQGDNQEWQFGTNFMPFLFWKKNSFLDNHPHIQIQPTNKINGISGGLFVEKYFNENLGVKVALNYSKQRYDVKSMIISKDNNGNWWLEDPTNYFRIVSENNFNYFIVPITLQYAIPLNKDKTFFSIIGAGPQISVFSKFNVNKYSVDRNGVYDSSGANYNITGINAYRKILFGGTAYAGLKFKISETFNGFVNMKYDYDFSNASKGNITSEFNNTYEYGQLEPTDPTLPFSTVNASKSHNMRLGIEFGLVYDFR